MTSNDDSGILGKLQGEFISRGADALPPAGSSQPATATSDVDVPEIGRVRIRYELKVSKHHKNRNWFWVAVSAQVVES